MSRSERQKKLAAGLFIDGRLVMGDNWQSLRAEMRKAGAVFDSDRFVWILRSAADKARFERMLNGTTAAPQQAAVRPPSLQGITVQLPPGKPLASNSKPVTPTGLRLPKPLLPPPPEPALQPQPKLQPELEPQPAPQPPQPEPEPQPLQPQPEPEPQPEPQPELEPEPQPEPELEPEPEPQPEPEPRPEKAYEKLLELPPSYIVLQNVSVQGAVSYERLDLDLQTEQDDDGLVNTEERRTTIRRVRNADEYTAATQLAGRMRTMLRSIGYTLHSGVVFVRQNRREELDAADTEMKQMCIAFNKKARHHFVRNSLVRVVATSDAESAAREIACSIQEQLRELRDAVASCDVDRIRNLAGQAKAILPTLREDDGQRIQEAIDAARLAASYIRKEVVSKGRQIEDVRKELDTSVIDQARLSFLQFDVPEEVKAARSSVEQARFEELELNEQASPTAQVQVDATRFADLLS